MDLIIASDNIAHTTPHKPKDVTSERATKTLAVGGMMDTTYSCLAALIDVR